MEEQYFNEEISILSEDFDNKYNLRGRTKIFSYKCFDLCELLPSNYHNYQIKGQLFRCSTRCSTSVAANYRATCLAQSKASFIAKISIVLEEADESIYWLSLLRDKNILNCELMDFLHKESVELTSIFVKSRKTGVSNLKQN